MSNKDAILKAVAGLPDSINWDDVASCIAGIVARDATEKDVARFFGVALPVTPEQMALYANPPTDGIPIQDMLAELEGRGPSRAAG